MNLNSSLNLKASLSTFLRKFACVILSVLALLAWPCTSQAESAEVESLTILLDAICLVDCNVPDLFFKDIEGEYQPFNITTRSRGSLNEVPNGSTLSLFRAGVNDRGEKVMLPSMELTGMHFKERAILFFYVDENERIAHHMVDDSSANHPAWTTRIVNLTKMNAAVQINEDLLKVSPFASGVTAPITSSDGRFSFVFAVKEVNGYKKYQAAKTLRFPSADMRFLGAITCERREQAESGGDTILYPTCIRLYDRVKKAQ